ncbi:DUF2066 domain-containing protein [Kiloniella sp. b19]|uniref:DUF2066 domain-containing protein n=1 Tax=Kiloniella sp. GXU_MW_B19 TaxID=3141326 RepID=UPI0031E33F09
MRFHRFFCHFQTLFHALFVSAVVLGLFSAGAQAGSGTIYTVQDVNIDVTADSVSQAKEQALKEGNMTAFAFLMDRLVASDQRALVPELTQEQIVPFIQDFSLKDERSSAVRYTARLTVRFVPDQVLALLRQSGVSVTETVSRPVLLLPVWSGNGQVFLWEDTNAWRDAWLNIDLQGALVPLVVPLGDLEDVAVLNAQRAADGGQEIWALASKYGVRDVILASLVSNDAGEIVQGSALWLGRDGSVRQDVSIAGGPADMETAARQLNNQLQETWILANRVNNTTEQWLAVSVPLQGLSDWVAIRNRIGRISAVKRSTVRSLSKNAAELDLFFLGTIDQLSRALAQEDVSLRLNELGDWMLFLDRPAQARQGFPDDTLLEREQVSSDNNPPGTVETSGSDTPLAPTVIIE